MDGKRSAHLPFLWGPCDPPNPLGTKEGFVSAFPHFGVTSKNRCAGFTPTTYDAVMEIPHRKQSKKNNHHQP